MVTAPDHYQVLGVSRTASPEELRAAYVRLAKRHHPDAGGGDSPLSHRLHDVQRAYRCLSDPKGRAEHDRLLDQRDRAHLERQRAVRRRLRRYDRRHPRQPLRNHRPFRWRSLLMVALGAAVVARVSLGWMG